MKKVYTKKLYSTSEVADMLGISRIAVFKQIQSGKIKAVKVGRNYVIRREDLPMLLGDTLSEKQKKQIDAAVKKTIREYGDVLKLLAKE